MLYYLTLLSYLTFPGPLVSARHRISPYPIISIQEAFDHLEKQIVPLGIQTLPVLLSSLPSLRNN